MKRVIVNHFILAFICFTFLWGCKKGNEYKPVFIIENGKITSSFCGGFGNQIVSGNDHVLISSYTSVYVFKFDGQGIKLLQTIDYDRSSVISMVIHNSTLAVGIDRYNGPGVLIYERMADSWEFRQEIRSKRAGDYFGINLDIDGNFMVIGAPAPGPMPGAGDKEGWVYIYKNTTEGWIQQYEFPAEQPVADDQFGSVVAIYRDLVIAGSAFSRLHIYKYETEWKLLRTDTMKLEIMHHSDSCFMYNSTLPNQLGAFILEQGGTFNYQPVNFDFNGKIISGAVEIKNNHALIGMRYDNICYLLEYENNQWTKKMVFEPDAGESCTFYGLAIGSGYAILGGESRDVSETSYVYFRKY